MTIGIINGPNLNLLGKRNPPIYGSESFDETIDAIRKHFPETDIQYYQTNCEGEIIDCIQRLNSLDHCIGIVINPGAYAHYSYAIADAIADSSIPVIEVHISNIHSREEFRSNSVTAHEANAVIAGFGREGYRLAVEHLIQKEG